MNVKIKTHIIYISIIIFLIISFSGLFGGAYLYYENRVDELLTNNSRSQAGVSNVTDAINRLIKVESEINARNIIEIRKLTEKSETNSRELEKTNRELAEYKRRETERIQSSINRLGSIEKGLGKLGDIIKGFKKE